jgi:DNA-binding NtrC family response regulator
MVVDDDEDFRTSVATVLEGRLRDAHVVTAACVNDARAILDTTHVDLVLTDYRMRGGDGIMLRLDLQRTQPDVPCILVTAHADLGVITEALNSARFDGVLCKPTKASRLVDLVRELLAHRTGRPVPVYE